MKIRNIISIMPIFLLVSCGTNLVGDYCGAQNDFCSNIEIQCVNYAKDYSVERNIKAAYLYSSLSNYEKVITSPYYYYSSFAKFGGPLISSFYNFDSTADICFNSEVTRYTSNNVYSSLEHLDINNFDKDNVTFTILDKRSSLTDNYIDGFIALNEIELGQFYFIEDIENPNITFEEFKETLVSSLTYLIIE